MTLNSEFAQRKSTNSNAQHNTQHTTKVNEKRRVILTKFPNSCQQQQQCLDDWRIQQFKDEIYSIKFNGQTRRVCVRHFEEWRLWLYKIIKWDGWLRCSCIVEYLNFIIEITLYRSQIYVWYLMWRWASEDDLMGKTSKLKEWNGTKKN